jgi:hypothetical protein
VILRRRPRPISMPAARPDDTGRSAAGFLQEGPGRPFSWARPWATIKLNEKRSIEDTMAPDEMTTSIPPPYSVPGSASWAEMCWNPLLLGFFLAIVLYHIAMFAGGGGRRSICSLPPPFFSPPCVSR